ncbi:DUF389 domain-containing protein [Anthocerotibacter panamensis]|uniref:DUF389 domain-containing protein n=1 Tax=Anthocerotibacter panamensis TaxID=2857077 RepID=UPI001C406181|nr:DUF389 domain-containing protein [Anthocerotibacter panamensis]
MANIPFKISLKVPHVAAEDLEALQDNLLHESLPGLNYLVLVVGSCLIATLGLLSNSAAVIIGAMIIAPLMLPIRGIALGALNGNVLLFRVGVVSIALGTVLGVGLSCLLGLVVNVPEFGSEILARTQPTLLDLGIALGAGWVGAFAKVRRGISDTLAGVAISVALMPPVCVIGLGLSRLDGTIGLGAMLLYGTNLVGIALACIVTFGATGYSSLSRAPKVLLWTMFFTLLLVLPLSLSFFRLLTQAQLEDKLKQALLNKTITFQRVLLRRSEFDWLTNPPTVVLNVSSSQPITPRQVQLLEKFVQNETRQPFTIILNVTNVTEVRSTEAEAMLETPSK